MSSSFRALSTAPAADATPSSPDYGSRPDAEARKRGRFGGSGPSIMRRRPTMQLPPAELPVGSRPVDLRRGFGAQASQHLFSAAETPVPPLHRWPKLWGSGSETGLLRSCRCRPIIVGITAGEPEIVANEHRQGDRDDDHDRRGAAPALIPSDWHRLLPSPARRTAETAL